ncbi:hypothetical protein ACFLWS_03870 [Chloroflexota bacterium]
MDTEESKKQYKNSVAETFGSLSIGLFTAALIGSVDWATVLLIIFGAIFTLCGIYIFVPLDLRQQWFLANIATKKRTGVFKSVGWFIVVIMFAYNLTQTGVTWQLFVGIIFIGFSYVVLSLSIWKGWGKALKKSNDSTSERKGNKAIKDSEISSGKVKWWCSQCNTELASNHTGPCPNCGNTRKYPSVVENPIRRIIIKLLDHYALRSFLQLLVHIIIGLAAILYFLIDSRVIIQSGDFVTIMSSSAAASGALLAVSLAFATFMSRFATDWNERSVDRLQKQREKLAFQMKLSAQYYPDISRALVNLYRLASFYIPGQPIEQEIIDDARNTFHEWASPQALESQKDGKSIDFGNITHYDSFENHIFDANILCNETAFSLSELSRAERFGRSLFTYPPLITGWALILVFSLVFAFIGSMEVLRAAFHLPLLLFPIYLSLFSIIALIVDFWASIGHFRARETGYEQAVKGFTGTSAFSRTDK